MGKVAGLGLLSLSLLTVQIAFAEPVKVFVSIAPQRYFVEKIGGNLVDISVMVEPGASPATYEPKPRQMVFLAKTHIFFAIGVPFEKAWLNKIALSNLRMLVVHTEAGIEKIPMRAHNHRAEKAEHLGTKGERQEEMAGHLQENADHEHHGVIKDPHVWLSPPLAMLQARNILTGLLAVDPEHRSVYEDNYQKLIIELVALDRRLRTIFAGKNEKVQFMVFHPAWGYFAQAYGLKQIPIEIEGKEPKPFQLKDLVRHAKERGIRVIFVQPQFSWQVAQSVAKAIGGQLAFVDPLASDWAGNLREVAIKFQAALR